MIITAHDGPYFDINANLDDVKKMRVTAAPNCFMQSGGAKHPSSEYETIKFAYEYLSFGIDCVYAGNQSSQWINAMRRENIPIISHVELIPAKAN